MTRIVQAANFVGPSSGGIRTVLEQLALGYAEAGHEVIQLVPGRGSEDGDTVNTAWGRRITLRSLPLPGTGYRLIAPRRALAAVCALHPDRLEVHDRSSMSGLGRWARSREVRSLVVAHERLDRLVTQWLPDVATVRGAAKANAANLSASFDTVVCTTAWAAEEFIAVGAPNVAVVPLAADVGRFRPGPDHGTRERLAPDGTALLVLASRLSREKRPDLAIQALMELLGRGERAVLVVAGDGPLSGRLERLAGGLPILFTGHIPATELALLLATADVVLAPGPVETFGLAALEALASGTPVVANDQSALSEVLGRHAGIAAAPTPAAFADAVQQLLRRPPIQRAHAARRRAEQYDWASTVGGFLRVHQVADARVEVA